MKFRDLLEEYNIPTAPQGHHHQTHGWIQFDCPLCGRNSSKFHMGYNIDGGFVNCWQCGSHSLVEIIREITKFNWQKAKEIAEQITEDTSTTNYPHTSSPKSLKIPNTQETKLAQVHIEYLMRRKLPIPEIMRLWHVQGLREAHGRLSWRLLIPIIYQGITVSWTTRSLRDNGQRYISASPEQELMPHKSLLYGHDYIRHTAIIVEGPLDVWAIGPGAVATFGIAYTKSQITKLVNIPRRVVCYDNEPEAQRQARKLCNTLGAFDGDTINVTLDSKDPGAAKLSEIKRLRKFLE